MLRVGLTGGIGSGKSTVARRLEELGAVVVDADAVAREVVEPGEPTLAAIAARFGGALVRPDGSLDRAALAAIVFPDRAALADLDAITGPAITARVLALRSAVAPDRVSVFDMPLLVERGLWPAEHLTIVVSAAVETRVGRLVTQRGLAEADARHRIAAQASDEERREAADVWIDNEGPPESTFEQVDVLWATRLAPYDANLRTGTRSRRPETGSIVVEPDPAWAGEGRRLVAKLTDALGERAARIDHIGSTSVAGLNAKDVIDLQVGVRSLTDADAAGFVADLLARGFVRSEGDVGDTPHGDHPAASWAKRFFGSMDPGRIAHVHVREVASLGWEFALLFRDWMRADAPARAGYSAEKRRILLGAATTSDYVDAKEPWFDTACAAAWAWARRTGWRPS